MSKGNRPRSHPLGRLRVFIPNSSKLLLTDGTLFDSIHVYWSTVDSFNMYD